MHLLALPPELLGAELFSWLDTVSLTRLDQAVTSWIWRKSFVESYFYLNPSNQESIGSNMTYKKMIWLKQRNIELSCISLSKRLSADNIWCILHSMANTRTPLQAIQFNGNTEVHNLHIFLLAQRCQSLKSINLWNCYQISDASIIWLVSRNHQLQILDFWCQSNRIQQSSRKVTNKTAIAIAKHCPGLHTLNMSGCRLLTDTGILALATGCPLLQSLNVSGCDKITSKSLLILLQKCSKLTKLNIYDCDILVMGEVAVALQKVSIIKF